jgi:hypothetical protein
MWVILTCSAFALAFIAWAVWFAKGLINTGVYGLLLVLTIGVLYTLYSVIGYWGLVLVGAVSFVVLSRSAANS